MGKYFLVMCLLCAGIFPAHAQSVFGGGAVSVGIKENVIHAGVQNFVTEIHYSDNGELPMGSAPFIQESNDERPAVPNHVPGYNGKVWMLIKSSLVNAGEIKQIELTFKKDNCKDSLVVIQGDLSGNQADFWVDMSQFQGGAHPLEIKVTHMGGEVTYQILVFLFRSKKEVTDQGIVYLTVYDPERKYTPAEITLAKLLRAYEPGNGAKAYKLATGQDMPVIIAQPVMLQSNFANPGNQEFANAIVNLSVFSNRSRTQLGDGSFKLVSEDKTIRTEWRAGSVIQFVVPIGKRYRVYAKQKGMWQPYRCPNWISVSSNQPTEIIIEPREVK